MGSTSKTRDDFFNHILRGDSSSLRNMCDNMKNKWKEKSRTDISTENEQQASTSNGRNPTSARRKISFSDTKKVHPERASAKIDGKTDMNLLYESYPSTESDPTEGTLLEGGLPLIVAACQLALPEERQREIINILMETAQVVFPFQDIMGLFPLKRNEKGNNVFHELVRLSTEPWVELLVQSNEAEERFGRTLVIPTTPNNKSNSNYEFNRDAGVNPPLQEGTIIIQRSPLKTEFPNQGAPIFNAKQRADSKPVFVGRIETIMMHILDKSCKLWDGKVEKDTLLFQSNRKGYTPLELAVKLGSFDLACFLLDLEDVHKVKHGYQDLGKRTTKRLVHRDFIYRLAPLKEIKQDLSLVQRRDELFVRRDGALSLMECITVNKGAKALEFVDTVPLSHAIAEQWEKRFMIHVIWGLVHLVTTVALSVCASFRLAPTLHTVGDNHTKHVESIADSYVSDGHYVRAFFEVVVLLYSIVLLITELVVFAQKGVFRNFLKMLKKVRANERYSVVFILYSIFTITAAIVRVTAFVYEEIFLTIAVIMSWWSMIHFLRPFKPFALYTVMIQKVMFSDIFRFSLLFMFQLIGYTTAFQVLFEGVENPPEEYSSFGNIMFHLFKITIGLGDVGLLNNMRYPGLGIFLFVTFVMVSYIFLFNMVIAMMSETVRVVAENRKLQWRLQQLHVLIFIERRLLPKFRRECLVIIDQPCVPSIVKDIFPLEKVSERKRSKKKRRQNENIDDSGFCASPV